MILSIFLQTDPKWLQQVSFLYRAAVHTAAGLFSSVFWGTRRAARAIQCATPGSPPFNPPSPHPAPPPGTCTSSCAAAEPPCFVGVLCVLGVAPVRYFYIFFEFPAVELLRAPLPSRPVFFFCFVCSMWPLSGTSISSSLNSRPSSSSALGAAARFLPPTGLSLSVCMTTFPSRQVLIL